MLTYYFILNAILVELQDLLLILTLEDVEVFDCELFGFGPPDPEALGLEGLVFVEQVEDLFVVDLQEADEDSEVRVLALRPRASEDVFDGSGDDAQLVVVADLEDLLAPALAAARLVVEALHREGLARASLSVCEDR